MVIFRLRHAHKRHYAILCLGIVGFIIYYYSSMQPGVRKQTRREGLSANSSQFTLEGEAFRILGGSAHYFRIPRAHWKDRLLKMKACGLNTLTTYVPWNLHEPERGLFTFQDQLDLEAYLRLAAEVGLWVILRPGPYICSEWDLGGLPSWLLRDRNMKLRTTYPGFADAVGSFFDKLIRRVAPLQYMKGGPIIAVQVENEYGSYAKDEKYMPFIKEALLSRGITELLLTSDNREGLKHGGLNGVLKTINFQKLNLQAIQYLDAVQPRRPKLVMEYWAGWFDLWGDLHHIFAAEDMIAVVTEILKQGMSINLYMFHGGTNFGFMSGALATPSPRAMVTSYGENLPAKPAPYWRKAYDAVVVYQHLPLWDTLKLIEEPFKSASPLNMENLPVNNGNGQSYGYTLYETMVTSGGTLNSRNNVRDRALVFVDRVYMGVLDYKTQELAVPDGKGERSLSLLVENCGRVNYGKALDEQRKGLVGDIVLNNTPLKDFTMYCLDMKPSFINRLAGERWKSLPHTPTFPGFFQGQLVVDGYPRDSFLKLPGWGKGVVFINGQNLGRHWSIGPQQTLYLPGPWLNKGVNQVIVFEEQEADVKILFTKTPDLGMTVDIQ